MPSGGHGRDGHFSTFPHKPLLCALLSGVPREIAEISEKDRGRFENQVLQKRPKCNQKQVKSDDFHVLKRLLSFSKETMIFLARESRFPSWLCEGWPRHF